MALRDHLIELISVRNLRHRPEALFTLPRLCHFLDLVLPQLTPVRAPWADATRTLWTCHHIRAASHDNGYPCQPKVTIAYFFTSHDNIHHVRVFWGTLPLLLFSDPRMVHPVDVNRFQGQAVHRLHQQHVQLGTKFFRLSSLHRSLLRIEESERKTSCGNGSSRQRQSLHGYPPTLHGPFAVMPYVGEGTADIWPSIKRTWGYRDVLSKRTFSLWIWCSLVTQEVRKSLPFSPTWPLKGCALGVGSGWKRSSHAASVKLLQFALRASSASASAKGLTEEEGALFQAIRPLVTNPDCHFLAVLTVLVQSILEGRRTDCPISGVFGAGKTRAAAAMIAGLLVMDPTLKVMVVSKENAAAHAFAKHIESLQLPPSLEEKFGRLVGVTELEKGPASKTKLDVLPGFRNTVLRTKQVIIGCGGGFHQECTQPYSPVARWMSDVDVALNDEGQQYGNLDESSAIARVPRKGLVVWCGDHKQTPGGTAQEL